MKKPVLNILQVIYSLNQGGAERFVVDLSNELATSHKVTILTLRDDVLFDNSFFKKEVNSNVTYINFPLKEGFRAIDIYKIDKVVKELNPDVIHAHLDTIYYFLLRSIFDSNIKIFHTIHNDAAFDGRKKLASSVRRLFYKFNKVKPITISIESDLSYKYYYNTGNPIHINNGRKKPTKSPIYESVKKEILDMKENISDLVFIHLSRFNENQKNHSLLIRVFNSLLSERHNLILLIIGRDYDSEEAKHIQELATKGIYFLGGKENIGDYLFLSDAFCLTSNFEGLPISLLESLACGVIPICTPVGGIKNIIEHGITGYLSDSISEEEYSKVVREFINNPHKILKSKLVDHFDSNFSIKICALEHEKVYLKV
jgi:glycosyltransferase involved in cell wall biosynthesis